MRSPVKFLWRRVGAPLRSLSRDFKKRFIESGARVQLHLIEQRKFMCGVVPATGDLRISTGTLALLWACAHLNVTYWDVRQKAGKLGKKIDIDPNDHPELVAAYKLLNWALNHACAKAGTDDWPDDLPQPLNAKEGSNTNGVSDQIMHRALGFIICHEVAHVVLKHSVQIPSDVSIEQEKDADREALKSYFDGCTDPESGEFTCRALGVVTALYFAMLTGFFDGKWGGSTHPPEWLRVDVVLGELGLRDYHIAMVWASELKSLYLSLSGNQSGGRFPTPSESLQHLVEICSRGEIGEVSSVVDREDCSGSPSI